MKKVYDGKKILDLPLPENNGPEEKDVRGFLKALLHRMIELGEGFSGKRPFGDSGWEGDLEWALIKGNVIDGTIDEDNYARNANEHQFVLAMTAAIEAL